MTDENVPPAAPIAPAPVEELTAEEIAALDPENDGAPPENETPEEKDARLADLAERNKKLWGWNQRLRKKPASPAAPAAAAPVTPAASAPAPVASAPAASAAQPALSRDEAILIAQGLSVEEVEHANKVAALQGVPLLQAVKDDLFTTWKAKRDKDAKDAQAQLPPSRGARATMKKSFGTKGLSDDDHKELFKEKVGQ